MYNKHQCASRVTDISKFVWIEARYDKCLGDKLVPWLEYSRYDFAPLLRWTLQYHEQQKQQAAGYLPALSCISTYALILGTIDVSTAHEGIGTADLARSFPAVCQTVR